MIVADKDVMLMMTGNGDVFEPHENILAIGSGGTYALAAARALIDTDMDAESIARKAMGIAAGTFLCGPFATAALCSRRALPPDICIYTNHNFVMEVIECTDSEWEKTKAEGDASAASEKKE